MNAVRSQSRNARRRYLGGSLVASILILALSMMGCSGAESETGSSVLNSTATSSTEGFTRPAPPTFAEIQERVTLDQEQVEPLEAVYDQLVAAMQTRHENRQDQRGKGMRGRRFGGESSGEFADAERPMQTFLLACSDILTPDQFVALVNFLADYQEAQREAMAEQREARFDERGGMMHGGGRGGFGGRGQQGPGFIDELNLTEDQQTALQDARKQNREAIRALIEAAGDRGHIDDATREQIAELRDQMKALLETILTPEQLAQLEELRDERRTEMKGKREANFTQKLERRIEFLSRVLQLSKTQKQQITDILTPAHEQMQTLHENAQEQDLSFADVRAEGEQIKEQTETEIQELLTAEQATMFEALRSLLPQYRGPGRGFRLGR